MGIMLEGKSSYTGHCVEIHGICVLKEENPMKIIVGNPLIDNTILTYKMRLD